MIVVIPQSDPLCNPSGEPDWEWLPRVCPACGEQAVVGHGRRPKQAHDPQHTWIRIRRGFCNHCESTCSVLPAWSLPRTHYGVKTRQQSYDRYCSGLPVEQSPPALRDADRIPDASTLRRWFQRRIGALLGWMKLVWPQRIFQPPTILAWDWRAALRILIPETKSG